MEEFWMIIGLILTGCVILLTYYLALVLKELAERLRESKSVISNVDEITNNVLENQRKMNSVVESVENFAFDLEETFNTVKNQILIPFTYVMKIVQKLQEQFGRNKEDESQE